MRTMPEGFAKQRRFAAILASPCHAVIGIESALHSFQRRFVWSLISATKGEISRMRTPSGGEDHETRERAGKRAASVFPAAVGAERIKLSSVSVATRIAAS